VNKCLRCRVRTHMYTFECLAHTRLLSLSLPVGTAALEKAVCQLARRWALQAEDVWLLWSGVWTVSLSSLRGSSWHWTPNLTVPTPTRTSSGLHWHLVDTRGSGHIKSSSALACCSSRCSYSLNKADLRILWRPPIDAIGSCH